MIIDKCPTCGVEVRYTNNGHYFDSVVRCPSGHFVTDRSKPRSPYPAVRPNEYPGHVYFDIPQNFKMEPFGERKPEPYIMGQIRVEMFNEHLPGVVERPEEPAPTTGDAAKRQRGP